MCVCGGYFCTLTLLCGILLWPTPIRPQVYGFCVSSLTHPVRTRKDTHAWWSISSNENTLDTDIAVGTAKIHGERKRERPETKQRVEPPCGIAGQWELCACTTLCVCSLLADASASLRVSSLSLSVALLSVVSVRKRRGREEEIVRGKEDKWADGEFGRWLRWDNTGN